ncbi:tyrosine-type recombinase/integrase [Saccharopolyspora thermophila]|uniref:tyrosine-type recombinase/integrase n=1 Tax=Saccharopolyspora thermophila TaxID=89367 RepID=UPI0016656503|nr:site-specific integrase [Saccharopolyspora subtropica]
MGQGSRIVNPTMWLVLAGALEQPQSFPDKCKRQAEAFKTRIESEILSGAYIDPDAGKRSFASYVANWIQGQAPDPASREVIERQIRARLVRFFGSMTMERAAQPSSVRDWLEWLRQDPKVGVNYQAQLFDLLSSILSGAVADKLIRENPMRSGSIKRPTPVPHKAVPWDASRCSAVKAAMPARQRIAVDLGTGLGMRQGEILGFSPDDIETTDDGTIVHIQRQARIVGGELVFRLPKGRKTRIVPLSDALRDEISEHARKYPAVPVTLPWDRPGGKPVTARLLLVRAPGQAWDGRTFNAQAWRPAFTNAGLAHRGRIDGMHALRHTFASTLLAAGVTVRELADYLGHKDPGFTLRVYTHLLPSSHDRARAAIDAQLTANDASAA